MRRTFVALRPYLLGVLSFVILIGIWQFLVSDGIVARFLISSPGRTVHDIIQQAGTGQLWSALKTSAIEFAWAMGLSIVVGVVVGVAMGWWRRLSLALGPIVWICYSSPFIALGPVFILTFGLGRDSVICIAFLLAVFVIMLNAERGVLSVDAKLIQAARSFGANDVEIMWKVVLPASMPLIMAGIRNAIGRALAGVVVGELFFGRGGVGYTLSYYEGLVRTDLMIAYVVVIGAIGVVLTQAATVLERRVDRWRVDPT